MGITVLDGVMLIAVVLAIPVLIWPGYRPPRPVPPA